MTASITGNCWATSTADPWFPENNRKEEQAAKKVCAGCVARVSCLQQALDSGQEHGVWGGTTPTERRRMLQIAAQERAA